MQRRKQDLTADTGYEMNLSYLNCEAAQNRMSHTRAGLGPLRIMKVKTACRSTWTIVRGRPQVAVIPIAVLAVLLGVGVYVVLNAASITEHTSRVKGREDVNSIAVGIATSMRVSFETVNILTVIAQRQPQWGKFSMGFNDFVGDLIAKGADQVLSVNVAPQGVVGLSYPVGDSFGLPVGTDIMDVHSPLSASARRLMQLQELQALGPFAAQSSDPYTQALLVMRPVIITNLSESAAVTGTDFGVPDELISTYMREGMCNNCYNATTGARFWGFMYAVVNFSSFTTHDNAGFKRLTQEDYLFRLYRPGATEFGEADERQSVFGSHDPPRHPISSSFSFDGTNTQWLLELSPFGGWRPSWVGGALAAVVLVSVMLAVLVFGVLLSRRANQMLLESVVPAHVLKQLRAKHQYGVRDASMLIAGSPAELILTLTGKLLVGQLPELNEVLTVQTLIYEHMSIYQPLGVKEVLMEQLEADVAHALLAALGQAGSKDSVETIAKQREQRDAFERAGYSIDMPTLEMDEAAEAEFGNLRSALINVMSEAAGNHVHVTQPATPSDMNRPSNHNWLMSSSTSRQHSTLSLDYGVGNGRLRLSFQESSPFSRGQAGYQNEGGGIGGSQFGVRKLSMLGYRSDAQPVPPAPPRPMMDQVEQVLATSDEWQWDAFQLDEVTQGHALSTLAYYLMHQAGLIAEFRFKASTLARFLRAVENQYIANPYHNKVHAADVLQSFSKMLRTGCITPEGTCDKFMLLSCYLAAAVHDLEHVGQTNDFLVNTQDMLAVRYNDASPLENHHLAATFTLLRQPDLNFLSGMDRKDVREIRKIVIELVLATDMKLHLETVSQFNTMFGVTVKPDWTPATYSDARITDCAASHPSSAKGLSSTASDSPNVSGTGSTLSSHMSPVNLLSSSRAARMVALKVALKCSDLGHLYAEMPIHLQWVHLLESELFNQGDMELAAGLPISPLFDRTKPGVTKAQVGFFDFVAKPLMNTFCQVFPRCAPIYTGLVSNYTHWQAMAAPATPPLSPSADNSLKVPQPAARQPAQLLSEPSQKKLQVNTAMVASQTPTLQAATLLVLPALAVVLAPDELSGCPITVAAALRKTRSKQQL